MTMTNFLAETIEAIKEAKQSPESIIHIGASGFWMTWEEFQVLANFPYHSGYGSAEIPTDLKIVFKDNSWLERGEYDGSEWWDYKQTPDTSKHTKITCLQRGDVWTPTLAELN